MANDPKAKDGTKVEDIFSISFEDDFEGMPGVTQLLNPKSMKEKAEKLKAEKTGMHKPQTAVPPKKSPLPAAFRPPASATKPAEKEISISLDTNAGPQSISLAVNTLADFGVQFELHFQMERGVFRYAHMLGHAKSNLSLWQEKFYFHMRLDLQLLGVKDKFHEFSKGKDFFQEDAFGLSGTAAFAQVVRLDENNSQTCIVLISEKSLESSQQKVRELLNQSSRKTPGSSGSNSSSGDDDFKIELAS